MPETELQVADPHAIVITNEQKELVKKTVFQDATDAELNLFFYDCLRRGVHPLDKLIHPTKRNGKYTPITSIDMFRMRAGETGLHMGTQDAVYKGEPSKPEFEASVTVYKQVSGEKCPFTATARWSEYCPPSGSDFMWRKMPHLMLAKCAEALALRKAFPGQLHGLYTPEEMAQAETPIRPNIPQIRPKQENTPETASKPQPEPPQMPQDETSQAPPMSAKAHAEALAKAHAGDVPTFTYGKHKGKKPSDLSIPDVYLSWIEPKLAAGLDDPNRARYRAQNEALLDAVREAIVERGVLPLEDMTD